MVMTETAVPPRSQIAHEHTWNAESVFASPDAWAVELKAVADDLAILSPFQGRLGESAGLLADWQEVSEKLARRVGNLAFYARMSQAVETTNQNAISMSGQAGALFSRFGAAVRQC